MGNSANCDIFITTSVLCKEDLLTWQILSCKVLCKYIQHIPKTIHTCCGFKTK